MKIDSSSPPLPYEIGDRTLAMSEFPAQTRERARNYQRQGAVSLIRVWAEGPVRGLEARVRGSSTQSYFASIELTREDDGEVSIFGSCSCPVGVNCKHVAAAALQWRRDAELASAASSTASKPAALVPPATPAEPGLSDSIARWVAAVDAALERADEDSEQVRKRLGYVLSPLPEGLLGVSLCAWDLDRKGSPKGMAKAYDGSSATSQNPAKFLRASDLAIIPRLLSSGQYHEGHGGAGTRYRLSGSSGASILADMIETGRAHWLHPEGPLLRPGPPRRGAGAWRVGDDGAQRFAFVVANAPEAVAAGLSPLHYVDPDSGETGLLETDLPASVACRLLAAPPVPPEEAQVAAEALARVLPPESVPGPAMMAPPVDVRPAPVPHARLTIKAMPQWGYQSYHGRWSEPEPEPVLELAFDYDGARYAPDDARTGSRHYDGARVNRVHRDMAAEADRLDRLFGLGFTPFPLDWNSHRHRRPKLLWFGEEAPLERHVRFLIEDVPALQAEGWVVEIDDAFPVRLAIADGQGLDVAIGDPAEEGSGIDWFDLSVGVSVGGERLDLLPTLAMLLARLPAGREQEALAELSAAAAAEGKIFTVALPDGRILPLEAVQVLPILEALLAVWSPAELVEGARLHPAQASTVADLEARLSGVTGIIGGARLKRLAEELAGFRDRPPSAVPAWFAGHLRPYQQTGLDWLQMLSRAGFGGVLADDMGLGKTVQLLAHLAIEKEGSRLDAPALVVAPTSVLGNWQAEAARFAPRLTTLVHQGNERAKDSLEIEGIDLVITSYPLLARDQKVLLDRRWSIAVLDEAQTIRNPRAQTALAAFALQAGQRIALSGTPVENHLGDVWSLMHFLNPGLLGDAKAFRSLYRTPIEKRNDALARARLSRRLKPFLLRRTKAEVAADLPEKTEIRESVVLAPAQRQLYEATRLTMQKKVREALEDRGLAKSAIIVLDALLKLRQACCDPRLVKRAGEKIKAGGSAKLDRLIELIAELKEEGRAALVFSQFTSMLDLIRAELDTRGWRHAWLTGSTTDRATPVASFQAGEVDLFLISLKAGGVGLNLTRADTVILYDPWWNPAVEAQAIDRAHRIGQLRKIFVHRLIAEDTIEEKMLDLQARKQGFADALWDGDAHGFAGLSDAEVRALFD